MGALRQYNAEWQGWQLDAINASLEGASPRTIALWALAQRLPTMVSTSFGRDAAALLHLISELAPEMPAIWVDTGFATAETRDFAHQLTERLDLNLQTYRPAQPAISVLHEFGVSDPLDLADADREGFVQQVKLQPFQRAVDEWQPKIWLTGIRAEETEFRRGLHRSLWTSVAFSRWRRSSPLPSQRWSSTWPSTSCLATSATSTPPNPHRTRSVGCTANRHSVSA